MGLTIFRSRVMIWAMAKYDALREHLRRRQNSPWTASLDELSQLVPGGLPSSAYRWHAWWSNSRSHIEAHAWLDAGWRTEAVDLVRQRITFVRAS